MRQSLHMFYRYPIFATGFECFVEKFGCMYIIVAEANKLTVIDYLIYLFCELFSIIDMLKEVSNWCGWIPTCSHVLGIGCEVGGGDGYVLIIQVSNNSKSFTLAKLGDEMSESGHVFFWTLFSDNGD